MPAVPSSWGVFLMPPNQFVFIERPHAQLQCIGEPSNKESRQSDPQGEEGGGMGLEKPSEAHDVLGQSE